MYLACNTRAELVHDIKQVPNFRHVFYMRRLLPVINQIQWPINETLAGFVCTCIIQFPFFLFKTSRKVQEVGLTETVIAPFKSH